MRTYCIGTGNNVKFPMMFNQVGFSARSMLILVMQSSSHQMISLKVKIRLLYPCNKWLLCNQTLLWALGPI